jgi:arylsulfatase A-like enzyme
MPSLVVITLDTTRVDALSAYGGRGVTPSLDAFASEATRFEQAFTTAPYTGPSHASLLTGQNPPKHGLRDYLAQALPANARTLAEILREQGYQTAAFVSSYVLDARFGLDQGFDVYDSPVRTREEPGHWRPGPRTVARALDWLRRRDPESPFLLWVHLYDAHGPYMPPLRYRDALPADVRPGSPEAQRQRYYEQASVLDEEAGRILSAVAALPEASRIFVAIASDHGETLGEHGRRLGAHSNALVDTTIRIPLLLRIPGHLSPGVRTDPVSLIDVLPSLLEALELPVPAAVEGRSLLSRRAEVVPAYSETFYEFAGRAAQGKQLASLRDGRFVLLSRPARDELFDLESDPAERQDVSSLHPDALATLRRRLATLRRGWSDPPETRLLELSVKEQADHEGRLRALGYLEREAEPVAKQAGTLDLERSEMFLRTENR